MRTLAEMQNISILHNCLQKSCCCTTSKYNYLPVGHVITGNLDLLPTSKLKKVFSKGAKFRDAVAISKNDMLLKLQAIFQQYCAKVSKRSKVPLVRFSTYKKYFLDLLKNDLQRFVDSKTATISCLSKSEWQHLRKFQEEFVIAPADKANSNYIFICKKYYLSVVCHELGISWQGSTCAVTGNGVYAPVTVAPHIILHSHASYITFLGLRSKPENNVLPRFFAVPKLHKN